METYHLWFKFNGEMRCITFVDDRPIVEAIFMTLFESDRFTDVRLSIKTETDISDLIDRLP